MLLLSLLWSLVLTVDCKPSTVRIAGGIKVKQDQFPFFAQLAINHRYNSTHSTTTDCGASLIQPQWILTAGHCVAKPEITVIWIFMGRNHRFEGTRNAVKEIYKHPNYIGIIDTNGYVIRLENDIAVAKLWYAYRLDKHIQTIQLPEPNSERCKQGQIVGIGLVVQEPTTMNENVLYADIESKDFDDLLEVLFEPSVDTLFYSEAQWMKGHTMRGDSGGPFVCYKDGHAVVHGIVSSGRVTSFGTEITNFEDVVKHLKFINEEHSGGTRFNVDFFMHFFVSLSYIVR